MPNKPFNWEILSLTRFVLACVVMCGHLRAFVDIGRLNWFVYLGSFEAILGFLLISGVSIGKSISKNKTNYFKRRIQRIYPVYLASLLVTYLVLPQPITWTFAGYVLINLIFLNQALTSVSFVSTSWTLAVEVWLYALAPVFLKMNIKQLYAIIYGSFLCYCFYTCGRTLYHWNYYSGTKYGIDLVLLAFIWVAGFTLTIFPERKRFITINIALLFIGHILLTVLIQTLFRFKHHEMGLIVSNDLPGFIGKLVCVAISYYVVLFNHKMPVFSIRVHRVFNFLGNLSYPLYLIHFTIYELLTKWKIQNISVMILCCLFASFFIYWIFDFYSKKRVVQ